MSIDISKLTKESNKIDSVLPVFKKRAVYTGEIYNNPTIDDLEGEIWVDAFGYDGVYEVSNLGRIKSLGRWVSNGKSERWVKEKIRKQVICSDGRLTCPLSHNNIQKSINVSAFIFYSFNPKLQNDNLNDEVYHINKIQHDNRICNLSYNKIKGKSYKISMDLGNVKHLHKARKKHHKYTKDKSIFKNGRTTHRTCRCCNTLKEQKEYRYYGSNTCLVCENKKNRANYRKLADKKGTKKQVKILIKITDTKTGVVYTSSNKAKCIISKALVNRYANTGNLVYPYKNSKHKNPLLVEIHNIESNK